MVSSPRRRENPNPNTNPRMLLSPASRRSLLDGTIPKLPTQIRPVIITRSDPTYPYPTTFVQADTSSFKQAVQMLTGSHPHPDPDPKPSIIPPIKKPNPKKQNTPGSRLTERRSSLKTNLSISPLNQVQSGFDPTRKHDVILSPSFLDFPELTLSPVTPLLPDPFDRPGNSRSNYKMDNMGVLSDKDAEEKAIKEKRFYLHPSPRNSEPRLLALFPVTSPRVSVSGSSTIAASNS